MSYPEYYRILKVKPDASPEEIRKAYHKLVKEYHPDTHKGDKKAEEKLKEINEAYNTLKDLEKRAEYDYSSQSAKADRRPQPEPTPPPPDRPQTAPTPPRTGIGIYLFRKLFVIALFVGYIMFLLSNTDSRNPQDIKLMLHNSAQKIRLFIKDTAQNCQDAAQKYLQKEKPVK